MKSTKIGISRIVITSLYSVFRDLSVSDCSSARVTTEWVISAVRLWLLRWQLQQCVCDFWVSNCCSVCGLVGFKYKYVISLRYYKFDESHPPIAWCTRYNKICDIKFICDCRFFVDTLVTIGIMFITLVSSIFCFIFNHILRFSIRTLNYFGIEQ